MRTSRIFSIAVLACAMACSAVSAAFIGVGRAVTSAFRLGVGFVVDRLPKPADPKIEATTRPRMALVIAREFVRRLIKRERPVVMPQWRMCPSL